MSLLELQLRLPPIFPAWPGSIARLATQPTVIALFACDRMIKVIIIVAISIIILP